jgi:arylsulfatase
LHKGFPTEGGTRVAAFVRYPEMIKPAVSNDFIFIKDVAPTILELTGIEHPGNEYGGHVIEPMGGVSFVSLLEGDVRSGEDRVIGIELLGKRAVRKGDWKLVHMPKPYGIDDWQLFNVSDDISESRDLSADYPERVAELKSYWDAYAEKNKVIIPDWVSGY